MGSAARIGDNLTYPLVKRLAADGIPATVTCRVLKLASQSNFQWLAAPVSDLEIADAYVANALFAAHVDDPEFGYRLLADEIRAVGHRRCDRTVWRIWAENRWWSVLGKKRGANEKAPGPPAHDDLVKRKFVAQRPNQLWLTDITEHPTLRLLLHRGSGGPAMRPPTVRWEQLPKAKDIS